MIVSVTLPANARGVIYGGATLLAADDHTLDVPDYVAKAILALPGVTGPAQKGSVAAMLAAADGYSELSFIFHAFGRGVPQDKFEPVMIEQAVMTGRPIIEEHEDLETGEKTSVITNRLEVVDTGETEMVPTGEQTLVEAVDLKAEAAALLALRGEPVASLI
jgi:hypothetical protein